MKKIHVGQLWLNRSGKEVRIVKEHNGNRMLKFTGHVNDRETEGYTSDGKVRVDGTDSPGDLSVLLEESPAVVMIHRLRETLTRVMSHVNDPETIAVVDALRAESHAFAGMENLAELSIDTLKEEFSIPLNK